MRQRGRAAPPAPIATLPPQPIQAIIAEAVHHVVATVSRETIYPDGSGGCAWYATSTLR